MAAILHTPTGRVVPRSRGDVFVDIDIIVEPTLSPAALAELGVRAERLGVRALWMSNYFAHWDAFVSLVPLAQQTSSLLFGPLAISPFEMHPMKIANSLLTLNEISAGRAMIAVGAGEGALRAMALPVPKRIVGAVKEAIELIRAAAHHNLAQGYSGEFFRMTQPTAMKWVTASPPLVYGTAYREQMMRMQGRVADGCFIGATPPEAVQAAVQSVRTGLALRDGKKPEFRINAFWAWHIKDQREAAYFESRRELLTRARLLDPALIASCLEPHEVSLVRENFDSIAAAYFEHTGTVDNIPQSILNRLCEAFTATGGIEDLERELDRMALFQKAGLTELALRLHDEPMEALELIGERVIPVVKTWQ